DGGGEDGNKLEMGPTTLPSWTKRAPTSITRSQLGSSPVVSRSTKAWCWKSSAAVPTEDEISLVVRQAPGRAPRYRRLGGRGPKSTSSGSSFTSLSPS